MERILVALDGSEHSDKALDLASDIASKYGAELVLLHVMSSQPLTDAERYMAEIEYLDDLVVQPRRCRPRLASAIRASRAQRVLQHYSDLARRFREAMGNRLMSQARKPRAGEGRAGQCRPCSRTVIRRSTILRLAKGLHVDMIFLGSRGLGNIKGLLMGSVSHKVAQLAECTCVAVK